MSVYAGDQAIYRPWRGEPVRVVVHSHTAKRVRVIERRGDAYFMRYVSLARLEKVPGAGLVECR